MTFEIGDTITQPGSVYLYRVTRNLPNGDLYAVRLNHGSAEVRIQAANIQYFVKVR